VSLDRSLIGTSTPVVEVEWTDDDVQLYALAVGAGQDPLKELELTTENSGTSQLRALPTHALVLAQRSTRLWGPFGDYEPSAAVHARQTLTLARPWPSHGRASIRSTVVDMFATPSTGVVVTESVATDEAGETLFHAQRWVMVRGEGEAGAQRPRADEWEPPRTVPDRVATLRTRPEQALLYRLCGDRNRLHSDPAYARKAGFDIPILHGLCTLGFAARALCAHDQPGGGAQLLSIDARFRSPVTPGDELELLEWTDGPERWFEVRTSDGRPAIDHGRARVEPARGARDDKGATA
jgi:acyl dehydratase